MVSEKNKLVNVDIDKVNELQEYSSIEAMRKEEFMEDMILNKVDDYVVCVRFSKTEYTATDAMRDYLKKVAELKY